MSRLVFGGGGGEALASGEVRGMNFPFVHFLGGSHFVSVPISSRWNTSQLLKEKLTAQVPIKQAELKELKQQHGNEVIGEVTVDQVSPILCLGSTLMLVSFVCMR